MSTRLTASELAGRGSQRMGEHVFDGCRCTNEIDNIGSKLVLQSFNSYTFVSIFVHLLLSVFSFSYAALDRFFPLLDSPESHLSDLMARIRWKSNGEVSDRRVHWLITLTWHPMIETAMWPADSAFMSVICHDFNGFHRQKERIASFDDLESDLTMMLGPCSL